MKNSKETIQMPQMILDCILDPPPRKNVLQRDN